MNSQVVVSASEEIGCKNCGSYWLYARIKSKEYVCRRCGYINKAEE